MFFGTPAWALPSLDALLSSDLEVLAVVTNPDRPAGRGMAPTGSAVKRRALEARLEILQPETAKSPELAARLSELAPDVAVVVAYGKILPASLLAIPPLGFVNVHFSVLPRYRGAAPVQRALMEGDTETGVSVMVLTEGMDEGPVLETRLVAIDESDDAGTLGAKLAAVGAELLVPCLKAYAAGALAPRPQDHSKATYAPKVSTAEGRIAWARPARRIVNLVRALAPQPGAWTTLRGRRVKLTKAKARTGGDALAPGELRGTDALLAGTADGAVELVEVQMEGKRRMSGPELARGLRLRPGEAFA